MVLRLASVSVGVMLASISAPAVAATCGGVASNASQIFFFNPDPGGVALPPETIASPSGGSVSRPGGTYNVDTSPGVCDGLDGQDFLFMTSFSDVIDERGIQQFQNIEVFFAFDGNDVLLLDEAVDLVIDVGGGDDILMSIGTTPTNDTFDGRSGDDFIDGGAGNDSISGYTDDDTLFGGTGNDTVSGGDGDDIVHLGSGDDTYEATADAGDLWHDMVHVGSGFDAFSFVDGGTAIDFAGVTDQVLTGSILKTTFKLLGYSTTSLFEDLSDPTGTLDLFRFSDGSTVERDILLGAVPPMQPVPLPAGGLLLLSGLALVGWRGARRA